MKFCSYLNYQRLIFVLSILILYKVYYNPFGYHTIIKIEESNDRNVLPMYKAYKYQLINSSEMSMSFSTSNKTSSYDWFMAHKRLIKNIGADETPIYEAATPACNLTISDLGPISVNKTKVYLKWVEQQHPDVKPGGYYAPSTCKSRHRVAILVPYRNRETNLAIFLRYIHPLLKKQRLEYRIFVIEQYGSEEFNKGTLFNIGYLESQRFGDWQCVILHDVDLIPLNERILYSCPRKPTHMSAVVENNGSILSYQKLFGGVTAFTMEQYSAVNGYSNLYLNWGAEDDDMFIRVQARRYPVLRYNITIARYTALPHDKNLIGDNRWLLLVLAKRRFRKEGLRTTRYNLLNVVKRKLYTHILADVNPLKQKIENLNELRQAIYNFINATS